MTFRLYFNQCSDWPQIWSVDEGDCSTEVNVIGVRAEPGVTWTTARAESVPDTKREPIAWLAVEAGSVSIERGWAVFKPHMTCRVHGLQAPANDSCPHCGEVMDNLAGCR